MSATFYVKSIIFKDERNDVVVDVPILLQDKNGPCPLIALVNTLLLSDAHARKHEHLWRLIQNRATVKLADLLETLADSLVSHPPDGHSIDDGLLELLPKLYAGLDVNPRFDGTFEPGPSLNLFSAFDIDIIHGWIPEKDDPCDLLLSLKSYDAATEYVINAADAAADSDHKSNAEIIQQFLARTNDQFTDAGLSFIQNLLQPGSLAVLFRNNHFSTIYKTYQSEQILMLVTDYGYKNHKYVVWESISDIKGENNLFFSGTLLPQEFQCEEGLEDGPIPAGLTDEDYARQLQLEEDSNLASQTQQRYDRASRLGTSTLAQTARATTKPKPKPKDKASKKKDCVIM
ncbi:hypothetical protein CANCADRAFT_97136 [Tortispora caseinolytica NRRL Y-17796]|uniref:MINDY deubiquitinase domain-containing protein n=1 Tax=Tortispora caseinolytica NRRL Y-17796 TaxID=767744 RepID=A0A1E4TDN4_9ASCO|nr:hypothetical protein CANCADRAFT_97136 [Tortispora caseinolytica NRRL Y-17796]